MTELIYAGDGGLFKTCSKCIEVKSLSEFSRAATGVMGVRGDCKKCRGLYTAEWATDNRDSVRASSRKHYVANKVAINAKTVATRDRGKATDAHKRWADKNPDKVRSAALNYYHTVIVNDPKQRVDRAVSSGVYNSIVGGSKGGRKTFDLLGFSLSELIAHIEALFLDGMSWDNYGEWHIDHIVPKSLFRYTTPECPGFKEAWALSNLQPLWAEDNHKKNARLDHPSQTARS
jgi:hypothetical protein